MTHHAGHTKGRKEAAESLTEKKKKIKNRKILYFLFAYHSLFFCPFCSVVFVVQNVLSLFLETNV